MVKANEIHEQAVADFKVSERFAYSFIMKVKQIRDERLYKELGQTSFESYCESSWNVKRDYMDERIQIAESFGTSFDGTYRQLGHSKSLLLARMEPEVRKQIETTVNVDETAVRRLKEIEKALQESEREKENAKNSATHFEKLFNSIKNQPPRIETKTVEKVPDDYNMLKDAAVKGQQLNNDNVKLHRKIQELQHEMSERTTRQQNDTHAIKKMRESFKLLLSAVNQEQFNAKFFFEQVGSTPEAHTSVDAFLKEFSILVNTVFTEWKEKTQIKVS